jgi:hypothetical protein
MDKQNKICQSCGVPLSKDPRGCGRNADGSKNLKYCSYCYQNGMFVGSGMTVAEFQEFYRKEMIRAGSPKFIAWLLTRKMNRLERWKTKH